MLDNKSRISLFIGHFGSGKTEIALNFAKELSTEAEPVTLIDLDIVNPFFRSSDVEKELEKYNINLIKPVFANTNIDVPALPPEISSIFRTSTGKVIIDVGGDDLGAKAVSCYRDFLAKEDYVMYFVINTKRPFTSTFEKIETMLLEVQASTRLKVTYLVNNTNLLSDSKASDVLESNEMIKEIAKKHDMTVAFMCAIPKIADELRKITDEKILVLDEFIKLPWNKE